MELSPGYKQTEAGIIPNKWEARGLLAAVRVATGQVDPRNEPFSSMVLVAPDHIESGTGRLLDKKTARDQRAISGKYAFEAGDIIYSKIRPYLRKATLASFGGLCSADMYPLKPAADVVGGFILPVLLGNRFSKYAESVSVRSGMPKINRTEMADFVVALPPIDEQRAIAAALGDVDALLAGLDRLIAKKRDLKQAAMQQLLTGQTRLPGFQGEWESTTFGQIAQPRRDRVDPRSSGIQDFCVELEHIAPAGGELLGHTSAGEQSSIKSVFSTGDVLFGKLRAYLQKYWLATRPGVCSTEIWVLSPKSQLMTTEFLFQLVKTDDFIEAASNSYGTHMPRSDWSIVKNFELTLPPVPEQTTIAAVLSDMDAERTALEARRDKTRALKQAMMQELLTGKTRLV